MRVYSLSFPLALLLFLGSCGLVGCGQQTSSVQPSEQRQIADSKQDQQGTYGRIAEQGIYVFNGSSGGGATRAGKVAQKNLGVNGQGQVDAGETEVGGGGNYYVVFSMPNQIGGTTSATQTGGSASGQSNAASNPQSPHFEPKAAVDVPIAVGIQGGSAKSQGAAGQDGSSPATTDQGSTQSSTSTVTKLTEKWKAGSITPDELANLNKVRAAAGADPLPMPTPPEQKE